jgi:hypothetical protein
MGLISSTADVGFTQGKSTGRNVMDVCVVNEKPLEPAWGDQRQAAGQVRMTPSASGSTNTTGDGS